MQANFMRSFFPSDLKRQKEFMDAIVCGLGNQVTDTFGTPDRSSRIRASRIVKSRLNAFVAQPGKVGQERAKAKFSMVSSDLPELSTNSFDVTYAGQQYDLDWMLSFKTVPVEAGKGFFEIVTIDDALTVQLVPEGGKLALEGLSGSVLRVNINKYGQGIQWTDEMIRYRRLGAMLEMTESQIEAHWADKADRHYSALTAAGTLETTYQTTTGNTQTDNDIDTISAGYTASLIANKNNFRGLQANSEMLLYLPVTMKTRVNRAIKKLINEVQGSESILPWNIRPIYSLNDNLPAAETGEVARGLLVLPGRKIQTATEMDKTIFNDEDILSLSKFQVAWEYYGSGIGETDQIRTVVFG